VADLPAEADAEMVPETVEAPPDAEVIRAAPMVAARIQLPSRREILHIAIGL